ncbi:hypothetical protein [Shewanella atlantica]|uniref:Uncharacterized protein n=1 Tax=Shewanella atlantica TaxID=271099 RepID=A0A431WCG8_9GAMM|nr:hypothetical protein [Shewanella atlantica]RTR33206.1 hypothetical protein EKG39_05515 [Shewanella atlantica]
MRIKTLLATALFSTFAMAANVDGTNLSVHMESAHFSGAGNTVAISRLPITNQDTGKVSYYDITARFSVNASGELVFDKVASMSAVSFANAQMLIAGDYIQEGGCEWSVSQPSKDGNGYLIWALEKKGGKDFKGKTCNTYSFRVSDAPVDLNQTFGGAQWCQSAVKEQKLDSGLTGAQDQITYSGGLAMVTQSGVSIGINLAKCDNKTNEAGVRYGSLRDYSTMNLRPKT